LITMPIPDTLIVLSEEITPPTFRQPQQCSTCVSKTVKTEGHVSDGQSKYAANRIVFQMGADIFNGSTGNDDAWH
uniref:hypothetical protein n=1 Tax=Cedecea sp. MMO-103 TaxID=3081238 RepID=UPI0030187FFD